MSRWRFAIRDRLGALALTALVGAVVLGCNIPRQPQNWWEQPEGPLVTGPYIMVGGPEKAFVAFKIGASGRGKAAVAWWPAKSREELRPSSPDAVRRVAPETTEDLQVATLTGLPRFSRIAYQVIVGEWRSEVRSFRIGMPEGESFRFAAFGDTRTRHNIHAAVIRGLARERVDFVVHTGDMVDRGGLRELWDTFFQIERPLLASAPVFPSIGNHDMGRRDYYDRYWLLERWTGGKRYYAHDWGHLRLIALDGSVEKRAGSSQYRYVEEALAEAAKRNMFTVLFLHWPPYSSGKHGSQLEYREPITRLARKYGVELVIAGHDHNYERTAPIDGTTYIVSGSAGAPTRPVNPQWFTAHARTEPHYVLIDVEHDRLIMRAVNLEGNVFDTTVIRDNLPERSKQQLGTDYLWRPEFAPQQTEDDQTVDGATVDGEPVDGETVDDQTVDGEPVDGATVDGTESGVTEELTKAGIVTPFWTGKNELSLGWRALALPEYVVELALMPLGLLVEAAERYQIPRRVADLFEFGPITITPRVRFSTGDGFGLGGKVAFGGFRFGGLAQFNGDVGVGARYSTRVAKIEGRELLLRFDYDRDNTVRYYGLGNDSTRDDRRALGEELIHASAQVDVSGVGIEDLYGRVRLGYAGRLLYSGRATSTQPALMAGDPDVALPPGFDQRTHYLFADTSVRFDTRDSGGQTSRGVLAEVSSELTSDLNGRELNAIRLQGTAVFFLPILPRRRALSFHVGLGLTEPLSRDGQVPIHSLITIGRSAFLRGYDRERFRDRRGGWLGVEYRFPVWNYLGTTTAITASLFAEAGRVSEDFEDIFATPFRYSYGGGLALEGLRSSMFQAQLGASPEGVQLVFSGGGRL